MTFFAAVAVVDAKNPSTSIAKRHHKNEFTFLQINNIHEKITQLWLADKGVQLLCNTSAKLVTRVQITTAFWLAENTKETTKNQSD